MLGSIMNDVLILLKNGKEEGSPLKGSVQEKEIYVVFPKSTIDRGDVLKRNILNGEELFLVEESHYQQGLHGIPAHYKLKTKKINSMDEVGRKDKSPEGAIHQTINIGTLNAQNSQVGNGNVMTIYSQEIDKKILELIEEIKKQNFSQEEEKEYLEIVEAVKEQLQKEAPKKSIVKSLLGALPTLGNIATIASFIVSLMES